MVGWVGGTLSQRTNTPGHQPASRGRRGAARRRWRARTRPPGRTPIGIAGRRAQGPSHSGAAGRATVADPRVCIHVSGAHHARGCADRRPRRQGDPGRRADAGSRAVLPRRRPRGRCRDQPRPDRGVVAARGAGPVRLGRWERAAARVRGLLRAAEAPVPRARRSTATVSATLRGLGVTRREADTLDLVAAGLTNAAIAEQPYVSVRTVESHVSSLLAKLGARNRTELAARHLALQRDEGDQHRSDLQ
jgi:DNA-binding CsgD family transcriptional regulator